MRKCRKYQNLFSPLIDGYLNPALNEEIKEHILSCPSCKKEFEELNSAIFSLKDKQSLTLPENFSFTLSQKLQSLTTEKTSSLGLNFYFKFGVAFATILLFIFSYFYLSNFNKEHQNIVKTKETKKITNADKKIEIPARTKEKIKLVKSKKFISPPSFEKKVTSVKSQSLPEVFEENVLRVSFKSTKEEKNLKIKIFSPEEVKWEGKVKEGEVISLLVPVKIKGEEYKDVKVVVDKENGKIEKNFKVLFSDEREKICKLGEEENKGYVLVYLPSGKEINCSQPNLVNEIEFEEGKELDIKLDSGSVSLAPFSLSALCLVPSPSGKVELILDKETVDLTDFQFIKK